MANGFPDGEFFLLSTQAMLCLAANPGGTVTVAEAVTRSGSSIEYSHTLAPVAQVEGPRSQGQNQFQGWYLDSTGDPWGRPYNHLVSRMKVSTKGNFALHPVGSDFGVQQVEMWGTGRSGLAAWKAEDGYVFRDGEPDRILAIADRDSSPRPAVAERGGDWQRWHFIPFR